LEERERIEHYARRKRQARFVADGNIWKIPCDVALPCATQNELDEEGVRTLLSNGCIAIAEGASMPTTPGGVRLLLESKAAYGPAIAANAGGVATSALEMQQNASRQAWTFPETEARLSEIMTRIHEDVRNTAQEFGAAGNYSIGANIAGLLHVAKAMVALGLV
jgi:glutamate dehydrogenase (NADP+)